MTICRWCDEPVESHEQDPNFLGGEPVHFECGFRSVAGSVAHAEKRCSCYVKGSTEGDPPGMTKREAARAALEAYRRLNPQWGFGDADRD